MSVVYTIFDVAVFTKDPCFKLTKLTFFSKHFGLVLKRYLCCLKFYQNAPSTLSDQMPSSSSPSKSYFFCPVLFQECHFLNCNTRKVFVRINVVEILQNFIPHMLQILYGNFFIKNLDTLPK